MFIKGKQKSPYRVCIYGTAGVGKSELASKSDNALFFDFEDALDHIDCIKTPPIKSLAEMKKYVTGGMQEGYKTFVFDTVDAIEAVMSREICMKHKVESIGDMAFGRGYEALNAAWLKFMDMLDFLKSEGINTVLVAHEVVKRYEDPRTEGYDKILLKMHQKSAGTVIGRLDAVLYMTYDFIVKKTDNTMQKKKAVGSGQRIIFTDERPAFVAKNRYGMPHRIDDVTEIFKFLKGE